MDIYLKLYLAALLLFVDLNAIHCANFSGKDITGTLFGPHNEEIFPVAYADFNADKLTDVFAVSRNHSELLIYFAREEIPILHLGIRCQIHTVSTTDPNQTKDAVTIVGVAPGDFNGDGLLDVMVTFHIQDPKANETFVTVFQGNLTSLDCTDNFKIKTVQEPLMLDVNGDMIMDLFGEVYEDCSRTINDTKVCKKKKIWIFRKENPVPKEIDFVVNHGYSTDYYRDDELAIPNSNAFVDTNGDLVPELIIITNSSEEQNNKTGGILYEVKRFRICSDQPGDLNPTFEYLSKTTVDLTNRTRVVGQSIFVDFNQNGQLMHIIPFTTKKDGKNSGLKVILENDQAHKDGVVLPIEFVDSAGKLWHFVPRPRGKDLPQESNYTSSIVLRVGDFNLDGFPDLIGVLVKQEDASVTKAVLFENIPCTESKPSGATCVFPRTFHVNFDALSHYENVTLATFFDIHEDGLVDVVLVRRTSTEHGWFKDKYEVLAIQNSPDYDANFMKVMVLSPVYCPLCPNGNIPYGNIISGPVIEYKTTTQAGVHQAAIAAQMYRSSYMPLDLPYTIFGIGQSPNFIETLKVSVSHSATHNHSQEWLQIIPNSQIFVVPTPVEEPSLWTAKLFLTPSKAVLDTFGVLLGFCGFIALVVGGLQYKERREDRKERLEEANRFHMM